MIEPEMTHSRRVGAFLPAPLLECHLYKTNTKLHFCHEGRSSYAVLARGGGSGRSQRQNHRKTECAHHHCTKVPKELRSSQLVQLLAS